jgi:hypothetical protein
LWGVCPAGIVAAAALKHDGGDLWEGSLMAREANLTKGVQTVLTRRAVPYRVPRAAMISRQKDKISIGRIRRNRERPSF